MTNIISQKRNYLSQRHIVAFRYFYHSKYASKEGSLGLRCGDGLRRYASWQPSGLAIHRSFYPLRQLSSDLHSKKKKKLAKEEVGG